MQTNMNPNRRLLDELAKTTLTSQEEGVVAYLLATSASDGDDDIRDQMADAILEAMKRSRYRQVA